VQVTGKRLQVCKVQGKAIVTDNLLQGIGIADHGWNGREVVLKRNQDSEWFSIRINEAFHFYLAGQSWSNARHSAKFPKLRRSETFLVTSI
jgi:hypothetical protein